MFTRVDMAHSGSNTLAWMAGAFEGEGNIHAREPNDRTIGVVTLSVSNCDREIINPFAERYGGHIRCSNPNRPDHWSKVHTWSVAASSMVTPLVEMRPYIHSDEQRQRVDLALKIQAVKEKWPVPKEGRDRYRKRLRELVYELREINERRG